MGLRKPVVSFFRKYFLGLDDNEDKQPYKVHYKSDAVEVKAGESLARGLGDEIDWMAFHEGLEVARERHRPLMVLILKNGCQVCQAFKPKFAESKEISRLSTNFVMVNLFDDEEPADRAFAPDGWYVPRIFFLSPKGEVETRFFNRLGNPATLFYYPNARSIVMAMNEVLAFYPPNQK